MLNRHLLVLAASALLPILVACRDDVESPTEPTLATPHAAVAAAAPLSFLQVTGGGLHSCGVATDNRAYCWGENHYGQLGDGTFSDARDRVRPGAVVGGLEFVQLSLTGAHTCGVTTDRRLYCWGMNFYGQLGDGSSQHQSSPVAVAGNRQFRSVEVGQHYTCALSYPDNQAYCWGENSSGQLGDGTRTARSVPVAVRGGRAFRSLSAGYTHTCAVTMTYKTFCWGTNSNGQLGDGTLSNRNQPGLVAGGQLFKQVSAGEFHTCAVTTTAQAFCWGEGNRGQIGDGTNEQRLKPKAVAGGLTFDRLSAGFRHTCGETSGNQLYCWGSNRYGQLGDGTTVFRRTPVAVAGGLPFKQVGAGTYHTCGKTSGDVAYCWGRNDVGQVGDGTTTQRLRATPVAAPQ